MLTLDHVAFRVADLDRAIDFYTRTMGLEFIFRKFDAEHHEAFAFLKLDGGNLELLQALDTTNAPLPFAPPPPTAPYCPHLALAVPELDDAIERLRHAGVPGVIGPMEIPGRVRWAYLHDPDHNVLELVEWIDCEGGDGSTKSDSAPG